MKKGIYDMFMRDKAFRRILAASIILLIIITGSTIGYVLIEGWSFYDALYMTVLSITTTGFREVHPLSDIGKLFTIIVIIIGLLSIAYLGGKAAQFLIENYLLRRRRMNIKLRLMKNHYIVCGYGRMGKYICRDLAQADASFVVIEKEKELVDELSGEGYIHVVGDSTSDEILLKAGIKHAKGLIAVVSSDAENVFTTLSAKALNPDLLVVARSVVDEAESKLKKAGADRVIKPYEIVSHRMAQMILNPSVAEFIDIVSDTSLTDLKLEEITVAEGSDLIGKTLASSPIKSELNIIIVVIRRSSGDFIYNPPSNAVIENNDRLMAIGERDNLQKLAKICAG